MHIIGYILAVLIGISLGLIGGGGSILTVPVLVYFFGISPLLATSYSLVIVGVTSAAGATKYAQKGLVEIKTGLLFGASSIITVFTTRKFLLPLIPDVIFQLDKFTLTHSAGTILLFAVLMLMASLSMILSKNGQDVTVANSATHSNFQLSLYGILIGLITGFLGAGGGFLIIPALVFLCNLPMKQAIATSLFIIALNSSIGFLGDLGHFTFNWLLLSTLTFIALIGFTVGSYLGKFIPGYKLKKAFGWFVLLMGLTILAKEIFWS